ncbi:DUF222 domain-containing protein [Pseudolysinimonas sp.]|uniref:HNH endonuclease signature motif containing protein n=1 Tax=Pseudolysinimonas sp. TaxID=2680009 RepID=UPI00286A7F72|nr:DUF222 domain-containing protein [Pseudolysinimonas sp.]
MTMVSFRDETPTGDFALVDERMRADAGVIEAIVAADRMIASMTAAKLELIEFAHTTQIGPTPHALAEREFRAELATALRISERGAENLIGEAEILARYLPATRAALADGRITPRQASILVDELGGLDDHERDEIERHMLDAADQSVASFQRAVRRLRETRDADQAVDRHRRAREGRQVTCQPARDGMAWLVAHLPAAEALAIDSRLDDLARGLARLGADRTGEDRTIAQLRADALGDVLLDRDTLASRRFGDAKPTVVVTVPISVLMGKSEESAELLGYGPIDAETARELTAEAPVLRRMFTDPRDDAILALGRTRYRVTEDLRLWLAVRDGRCRFVGCFRRTAASDVDHKRAWAEGGATDDDNLGHLCRGHHTLKHETRWRIEAIHPDGTIDWISPTGRRHRSRPARTVGALGTDPP